MPPKMRGGSKWGRLLGSSSVDSASDSSAKIAVSRSLSARESLRESAQARSSSSTNSNNNGGQGNKVNHDLLRLNNIKSNIHIIPIQFVINENDLWFFNFLIFFLPI